MIEDSIGLLNNTSGKQKKSNQVLGNIPIKGRYINKNVTKYPNKYVKQYIFLWKKWNRGKSKCSGNIFEVLYRL